MYVCGVCGTPVFFWQMAYSVCLWRAVWVTGKWQAGPRSKRELYWALALLFLTPPAHIYHFLKRKWDSYNIMWYVGGFYILTAQLNTLMHINGHTRCHRPYWEAILCKVPTHSKKSSMMILMLFYKNGLSNHFILKIVKMDAIALIWGISIPHFWQGTYSNLTKFLPLHW